MQVSQTYNYERNDHINRTNLAIICSQYFGIKDVSPSLYQIAAPVSELTFRNKNGDKVKYRSEIEDAIPWDERSMKTFGVVYHYESTASFIGMDGRTYVVPNDEPVIKHLAECGYTIAPEGKNLDGNSIGIDTLISPEKKIDGTVDDNRINRNLPLEIIKMIDNIEQDRDYYNCNQSYAKLIRLGGTLGRNHASEEELLQLSLSERKIFNITTYGRIAESQDIEEYVQFALQHFYLNDDNFVNGKKKL